ncbi:LOW QUALITY PROTEIN: hypothetical protein BU14_0058s0047 [Porphyra umbilicalis]|uniref:Uncharacterized protein n=1 Tax=Porphyra umbilicalis TaxID=2786 RepID=A0A1X6PHD2_PORUM|nr:LOW QUALITY PROTEIN: hypothetical protein BU14_0058s0047 [Porphyra umbilicalis]|eukprot:OSX80136.1 LOW QUALITY PROTEIN: hypothetical protein BU14_0058s0047 [Porphyra umbilicalis]
MPHRPTSRPPRTDHPARFEYRRHLLRIRFELDPRHVHPHVRRDRVRHAPRRPPPVVPPLQPVHHRHGRPKSVAQGGGQPPVIRRRPTHARQTVRLERVVAGRHEHEARLVGDQKRQHGVDKRGRIVGAGAARRERHVEDVAVRPVDAGGARVGEERHLVRVGERQPRVPRHDRGGAIAVVHVPVEDGHPRHAVHVCGRAAMATLERRQKPMPASGMAWWPGGRASTNAAEPRGGGGGGGATPATVGGGGAAVPAAAPAAPAPLASAGGLLPTPPASSAPDAADEADGVKEERRVDARQPPTHRQEGGPVAPRPDIGVGVQPPPPPRRHAGDLVHVRRLVHRQHRAEHRADALVRERRRRGPRERQAARRVEAAERRDGGGQPLGALGVGAGRGVREEHVRVDDGHRSEGGGGGGGGSATDAAAAATGVAVDGVAATPGAAGVPAIDAAAAASDGIAAAGAAAAAAAGGPVDAGDAPPPSMAMGRCGRRPVGAPGGRRGAPAQRAPTRAPRRQTRRPTPGTWAGVKAQAAPNAMGAPPPAGRGRDPRRRGRRASSVDASRREDVVCSPVDGEAAMGEATPPAGVGGSDSSRVGPARDDRVSLCLGASGVRSSSSANSAVAETDLKRFQPRRAAPRPARRRRRARRRDARGDGGRGAHAQLGPARVGVPPPPPVPPTAVAVHQPPPPPPPPFLAYHDRALASGVSSAVLTLRTSARRWRRATTVVGSARRAATCSTRSFEVRSASWRNGRTRLLSSRATRLRLTASRADVLTALAGCVGGRRSMICRWPSATAMHRGVSPAQHTGVASAPNRRSASTTGVAPRLTAKCNAVQPSWSVAFTSARAATNDVTGARGPDHHPKSRALTARCSAVEPSWASACTSAPAASSASTASALRLPPAQCSACSAVTPLLVWACTSAPAASSASTASALRSEASRREEEHGAESGLTCTPAAAASSASTASALPLPPAQCSAVEPSLLLACTSAPAASSVSIASAMPLRLPLYSAVVPSLRGRAVIGLGVHVGTGLHASTASAVPLRPALCSAIEPSLVLACMSAPAASSVSTTSALPLPPAWLQVDPPYSGHGGPPVVKDPGKKLDLMALWLAHNAPHFTVTWNDACCLARSCEPLDQSNGLCFRPKWTSRPPDLAFSGIPGPKKLDIQQTFPRGPAEIVLGAHVGTRRQQRFDRLGPAAAAGLVQRGAAEIILGVHVGERLQGNRTVARQDVDDVPRGWRAGHPAHPAVSRRRCA